MGSKDCAKEPRNVDTTVFLTRRSDHCTAMRFSFLSEMAVIDNNDAVTKAESNAINGTPTELSLRYAVKIGKV
jgi:hypothetical protein